MGRFTLQVTAHALQRLRELRTDRRWSREDAARELQQWIDGGLQVGGQFRGQRCFVRGALAVVIAYDSAAGPTAITVLRAEHAIANSEIWSSGKPLSGRRRSRLAAARSSAGRRDDW